MCLDLPGGTIFSQTGNIERSKHFVLFTSEVLQIMFVHVIVVAYLLHSCIAPAAASNSDKVRLFSNGEMEYTTKPARSIWRICSLFGWGDPPPKARKHQIHLSRNLKIKRSSDTTLQIIDRCTNLPLPDFPGKFDSAEDLNRWTQQLQDIMKYDQSYGTWPGLTLSQ